MRAGSQIILLIAAILLLQEVGRADPAVTPLTDNQFLIKKWSTESGLPQVTVTSLVQTRDGYIWVGTFGGLARFDGIRFTVFDSANMPNFTSNRVLSLFEDSYGTLWIGAETGEIYTLRNLKLEEFRSTNDYKRKTVWGFEQDAAGDLFVASDSGLEKIQFDDTGVADTNSVKILSHELSYGIRKDPGGQIWVKIYKDYFVVEGDQLRPAADKGLTLPAGILQIRFAGDGKVLASTYGTLGIAKEGKYVQKLRFDGGSDGGFSSAWCFLVRRRIETWMIA